MSKQKLDIPDFMKSKEYLESEERIENQDRSKKANDREIESIISAFDEHDLIVALDVIAKSRPELMHKALVKREQALISKCKKISSMMEELGV